MFVDALRRVNAVLFDIDDTLCDDSGLTARCVSEVADVVAGEHGAIDASALGDAYIRIADDFWMREIGSGSDALSRGIQAIREELWARAFVETVGETPPAPLLHSMVARYGRLRNETPDLFDDAVETLKTLAARGYKLGVVTNGLSETHVPKIERLGIGPFFDVILMPDKTGFAKPDPRQFHVAAEQLGVAPQRIVHVGDSLIADISGAKSAGLLALWFNPNQKPLPETAAGKPDAIVSRHPQILDFLTQTAP